MTSYTDLECHYVVVVVVVVVASTIFSVLVIFLTSRYKQSQWLLSTESVAVINRVSGRKSAPADL